MTHLSQKVVKYPEKEKELINLAKRMKETDNPVLVLVRLKHKDRGKGKKQYLLY